MRTMTGALAVMLGLGLAAAPARAQDHHHPAAPAREHADEMQAHMRELHEQLGLTQAQETRLMAIHTRHAAAMREHCTQVRAAGGPNAQTHQALHGQMVAEAQAAHREAMAVLTAAQRAKFESLQAARHAEMAGHHAAGGHDMHAAHDSTAAADMLEMHGDAGMCQAASPSR